MTKKVQSKKDDEKIKIIKAFIEDNIKPVLQMDGGDVEFINYEDDILKIRLKGACMHCPSANMTLKFGIENRLKQEIPDIKEVVAV